MLDSVGANATPRLLTVKQFSTRHEAFTQSALRWLIFNAEDREASVNGSKRVIPGNGFAPAIKRVGRRVFIDESRFFAIVEEQNAVRSEDSQ